MSEATIAVKYIGRREYWEGHLYNVKLRFDHGQTRPLPEALALKFLTHTDTFKRDDDYVVVPKTPEQETEEALEAAAKTVKEEQAQTLEVFDVMDQVRIMEKDQLQEFATRYGTKLDKRRGVDALREEVAQLVNLRGLT